MVVRNPATICSSSDGEAPARFGTGGCTAIGGKLEDAVPYQEACTRPLG
jgi:hypothetical protein